ncbi:MAG: hypothetical protein JRJ31_17600 [Deltaproteobacteria bacterium]|nr:hypothetical protein [Deltaproteobacteria bacterium]
MTGNFSILRCILEFLNYLKKRDVDSRWSFCLDTFNALKKRKGGLVGLLMTAYGTMDTAIDAMAAGFSGFLRKPILPLNWAMWSKRPF